MTNTKSAQKSLEKSKIQRKINMSQRSMLRTFIKKLNHTINKKDKKIIMNEFALIQKIIDHQSYKGLIHKNKAARYKSKIYKKVKSILLN